MITYLLFKDSDNPLLRPLKKGFRHIDIHYSLDITYNELDAVRSDSCSENIYKDFKEKNVHIFSEIKLLSTNNYIDYTLCKIGERMFDEDEDGDPINDRVLIVHSKRTRKMLPRIKISPFTCVTLACYAIGTHPFVFTPYGLYNALKTRKFDTIVSVEEM